MNEMIERVARAQCAVHGLDPDYTFRSLEAGKEVVVQWHLHIKMAKAAIEAMREPTDRMRLAGSFAQDTPWSIYDAMIDAALADDQAMAL